jgi:TRAP-type C4-dicarboxylate transport system substrate-binding protein
MNLFHEFDRAVQQRTNGAVRVKFYSGGASGDERDMVRKMRLGQLSGAAVTSIGLGLIQPEVRVLEVPLLLQSWEELDYVRGQLDGELRKKFEDKGYVLLNWGDVGPIHLFSNTPV